MAKINVAYIYPPKTFDGELDQYVCGEVTANTDVVSSFDPDSYTRRIISPTFPTYELAKVWMRQNGWR
jgi:hypothetical protein